MPIFELDEGRPRLVQPMQPLAGSFAQETAALLTDHLAAIAGEPLFAVRSRTSSPDHADQPTLLALDATGRPVVIDVGQVLDDDAIVSALRHAGAAARMTTTDLARAYHPDPSRFAVDFAAFREQAAFGAQSSRREGVRVVLLCSEVAAEASDLGAEQDQPDTLAARRLCPERRLLAERGEVDGEPARVGVVGPREVGGGHAGGRTGVPQGGDDGVVVDDLHHVDHHGTAGGVQGEQLREVRVVGGTRAGTDREEGFTGDGGEVVREERGTLLREGTGQGLHRLDKARSALVELEDRHLSGLPRPVVRPRTPAGALATTLSHSALCTSARPSDVVVGDRSHHPDAPGFRRPDRPIGRVRHPLVRAASTRSTLPVSSPTCPGRMSALSTRLTR